MAVPIRSLRLVIDRDLLTVASPPQYMYCALGYVRGTEHWAQMLCPLPWLLKHISKFSGDNIIIMSSEQCAALTAQLCNFPKAIPLQHPFSTP